MINSLARNPLRNNNITYYLLALFLILLPFYRSYSELMLFAISIFTLFICKKKDWKRVNRTTFWLASLYILAIITTLYSTDKRQAFKSLESQLALILFPLILIANPIPLRDYRARLLDIFSITCTLTILYLFIYNFIVITHKGIPLSAILSADYINHNFSLPIKIHATYLSLYVALSICHSLYSFVRSPQKPERYLYGVQIFVLFIGLIQLSSKAVIISTVLIVVIVFPLMLLSKKKRGQFIGSSLALFLALFVLIISSKDLKERLMTSFEYDMTDTSSKNNIESRIKRWGCAFELIAKSPVIGYGNGSEKEQLKAKYLEKNYRQSYFYEFNSHNQYLSFLINFGIIGLLCFLYLLFLGISTSLRKNDFVFLSFLLLIIITSLSENIIAINKGVFFVGFFFSFFLYSNESKEMQSQ